MHNYIIDREKYTSHITDIKDLSDMRRILDIVEIVLRDHSIGSTDFLDPYKRKLAYSILNRFDNIKYKELGGLENSERKIILIYPEYHYLTKDDYPISALRLKGYIEGLLHPDFLGSILSLGITRDKLGDIYVNEEFADIIIKDDIKGYIMLNLDKVSNRNFEIEEINLDDICFIEDEFEEVIKTISSLRLDSYIGATYNLSRGLSQKLIQMERVRVNWEPIDKTFYELEEGDLISIRGYGRSKLYLIKGLSKKKRLIVKIRKLI